MQSHSDTTHGARLLSLYVMLLFNDREYSLTELAAKLDCSKQTVLRLVRELDEAGTAGVSCTKKGNRNFYRIPRAHIPRGTLPLTGDEMEMLLMCRAFTSHLLGPQQFTTAMNAVSKSAKLLHGDRVHDRGAFGVYRPGVIDYTPHQKHLALFIEAIDKRCVCEVTYRKIQEQRGKTYRIKPLKIFSNQEAIYLHARDAKTPGQPFKPRPYDPLLALHRFTKVELTDTTFKPPADYDFEKAFNRQFGLIQGKTFQVEAELWGWAAGFAAERRMNPDQTITKGRGGKIRLKFTASSEPEVMAWILGFGGEARLLAPESLVDQLRDRLKAVAAFYS